MMMLLLINGALYLSLTVPDCCVHRDGKKTEKKSIANGGRELPLGLRHVNKRYHEPPITCSNE